MKASFRFFVFIIFSQVTPQVAWAWGERGHDVVTRVAARLTQEAGADKSFTKLWMRKENMLAHLSNVPDIVWRNSDKEVIAQNSTTHFIDLDYLVEKPQFKSLPKTVSAARSAAKERGKDLVKDVGTATWRACQFYSEMTAALKAANSPKIERNELVQHVNRALLMAGLMSHFVGDLAQPLHAHSDYDGWNRQQGGLHSYFESDLVDIADLSLDDRVLKAALAPELRRQFGSKNQKVDDCEFLIWSLAVDSYERVNDLMELDAKVAVIAKSKTDPLKLPAKRKEPEAVLAQFEELIVGRLATGSHILSQLWMLSWKAAGSPDLSSFHSWDYPVAPAFLRPSYLD